MTTPPANGVTTYTYDAKNRLTTVSDNQFGSFRFGYDPMDRRTSLLYPNGVTSSYAYDNAYRITAIASKNALGDVIDAWSAVGNRISKTDMDGKVESYAYDNTYRLTEARYADGTREAFTYDPVGNRLTRADESGTTIQYSYDVANQLLSAGSDSFVYDANGSATSKTTVRGTTALVYDGQNRVTSIAGPDGNESSVWGPDGTRVRMNNQQWSYGDSKLLYDLRGNAIYDAAGYTIYRVFGPGVDEVLAEHKNTSHTYYYHHDALGSVTAVTNETGVTSSRRSYRAFGQMSQTVQDINAEHFSRYAFTGRELSVGTMMQYRSRYYDEMYGRLSATDSNRGNSFFPPSLHRYTYVLNSPANYCDPSGDTSVRLPAGMDVLLLRAIDVIAVLAAVVAFAGIASQVLAISAIAEWMAAGAATIEMLAIMAGMAIAFVRIHAEFAAGPQTLSRLFLFTGIAIVTGAIIGLITTVARGFGINLGSKLRALSVSDPRYAALFLEAILRVAMFTIILWIIDDAITDTIRESQ